ncbi:MAG: SEC-C metal-binding domain-containing protein [Planctomycetota bacterium]|nr:SEC-C metal-binding domain-containing protein [Planctomycetota bacterium]
MPHDPIEDRYTKRQKKQKLSDLSRRQRSTEDIEAEDEILAKAKAEREKDPDKYRLKSGDQPGRNDPCPCGSGKKYKKCCGAGK